MRKSSDRYFEWLLDLIDIQNHSIYWKLMDILFERPFYPKVFRDENRGADGLELREKFYEETGDGETYISISGSCRVLEMLIALANRIEYDNMHDPDLGDRTPEWFWIMISNLGLTDFDDYHFDISEANQIIDNLLERRYDRNGAGGLFTIHNPRIDMRREEFWYQAQEFLIENFE